MRQLINNDLLSTAIHNEKINCTSLAIFLYVLCNQPKVLHIREIAKRFNKPISKIEIALSVLYQEGYRLNIDTKKIPLYPTTPRIKGFNYHGQKKFK